jgi:hypothetical protein
MYDSSFDSLYVIPELYPQHELPRYAKHGTRTGDALMKQTKVPDFLRHPVDKPWASASVLDEVIYRQRGGISDGKMLLVRVWVAWTAENTRIINGWL